MTGGFKLQRCMVVDSVAEHVNMLVENIRAEDRAEIEITGTPLRKGVWRSYRGTTMRRTAFVDGKIAAMWGVGGVLLSGMGHPWLLTTKQVDLVPLSVVRVGRAEVSLMLDAFPKLLNYVDASYERACRFIQMLGFTLDEPSPFGAHGAPFRRFWMVR